VEVTDLEKFLARSRPAAVRWSVLVPPWGR
jgi:hypothetical protein